MLMRRSPVINVAASTHPAYYLYFMLKAVDIRFQAQALAVAPAVAVTPALPVALTKHPSGFQRL
jgi:hypothetical protein